MAGFFSAVLDRAGAGAGRVVMPSGSGAGRVVLLLGSGASRVVLFSRLMRLFGSLGICSLGVIVVRFVCLCCALLVLGLVL